MKQITYSALFAGFDGAGKGLEMAGATPINLFEYDPKLAEVGQANSKGKYVVQDIRETDWKKYDRPDWLWMSPVCTNASVANANAGESELDKQCATASLEAAKTWLPDVVFLENVYAYRNFESFRIIEHGLRKLGYGVDFWHLNAANYGVPQTRQRLIMVARKDGRRPAHPERTHAKEPVANLFGDGLKRWVGWYEAIEDLIPEMPDSQFAPWQMERMGEWLSDSFMVECQNTSRDATIRKADEPSITITCGALRRPSSGLGAFVVEGSAAGVDNKFNMPIRLAEEPIFTQRAAQNNPRTFIANGTPNDRGKSMTIKDKAEPIFTVTCGTGTNRVPRAQTESGRVVRMTPRALARFQSFPDSYELSGNKRTDCIGIGNAVPPLLAYAVAKSVL